MNKIEPIGIGGLHRGLSIPEIYIENTKLQSNWNSLREWLEGQKESTKNCEEWNNKKGYFDIDYDRDIKMFEFILDKMNELEGKDNNDKSISN